MKTWVDSWEHLIEKKNMWKKIVELKLAKQKSETANGKSVYNYNYSLDQTYHWYKTLSV